MDVIFTYFLSDPLKVLYLLGGAGGIWFWIEKWLDRIRLQVRVLSHSLDDQPDYTEVTLGFEVVNIGKSPTSLEPYVFCTGYDPKRQKTMAKLVITEAERLLPSHSTCSFTAVGRVDSKYVFWYFKTYRISPTRGRDRVLYSLSNPRKPLNHLWYDLQLTLYRWGGWLPFVKGTQNDS